MSMAQQLLFRMGYGFDAFETAASWQRYEIVISEYVSVLLSGLNGHTLFELLDRLGMLEEEMTESLLEYNKTMSFDTVSTVHSKRQIHPERKYMTSARESMRRAETTSMILGDLLEGCAPYDFVRNGEDTPADQNIAMKHLNWYNALRPWSRLLS